MPANQTLKYARVGIRPHGARKGFASIALRCRRLSDFESPPPFAGAGCGTDAATADFFLLCSALRWRLLAPFECPPPCAGASCGTAAAAAGLFLFSALRSLLGFLSALSIAQMLTADPGKGPERTAPTFKAAIPYHVLGGLLGSRKASHARKYFGSLETGAATDAESNVFYDDATRSLTWSYRLSGSPLAELVVLSAVAFSSVGSCLACGTVPGTRRVCAPFVTSGAQLVVGRVGWVVRAVVHAGSGLADPDGGLARP